ncbi:uncharacterized protein K452DRAFT_360278 [Aplosporella prunicola CBS 121167]|uniref:Heterokaryon incompatibility domain-containing protein n=1 Tax=Aplosporella prunicola CBS 121167 TaxID=1176127 RepID=A0A6A6BA33_9PEZI|nr:uncharacterized protein K452DRAFT_360278 [Aplosporella prunicola CBS 121167]KAF2140094.1 hypothetical protein K452DRAFT_360278 [Aplosporella prunicola CBS 121167]
MSPASSPLNERALATQEWLLSRRMLFYTKECMIWSCRTINQRETRECFGDVARMIEDYSTRKLTRPTDRLIALEGIIDKLQKRNNTKCLQGIWLDTRADQLLWFPLKLAKRTENPLKVPSCHGIRYQKICHAKKMYRLLDVEDEKILQVLGLVKEAPLLQYQLSRKDSVTDMEDQGTPDPRVAKILDQVRETGLPVEMSYVFCDTGGKPLGWATLDEGCLPTDQVQCLSIFAKGEFNPRQRWNEPDEFVEYWMLLLVQVREGRSRNG